ncbi:MAG: DUF302 domain-containing protein [Moritella sp.]|uniref:DUF302 domain-containing protein n=1 Tax=Moritella sp. TaxID=78556 RepID=UPI0029AFA58E|nr:DUF302 domain-containing protein [Moritella sp.]MDX2322188.1 DUF302 domain-containing protein [Moritella sp.]
MKQKLTKGIGMIKIVLSVMFSLACSSTMVAAESLISVKSNYTVKQSADRFEKLLEQKGLTLFSRINHGENAANVDLQLAATEVIIFGNPKVGTPLMQCSKTVAIDLPQKVLFWSDEQGQNWLSYNNPEYLKERHNITGCNQVITKIAHVLGKLTQATVSK